MFTANLNLPGNAANRGQLIVRTQAIQQSNYVANWNLRAQNVRNVGGGCMGMCSERVFYRCQIMKEVPGGGDRFTVATTVPGQFNSTDTRMPIQSIPLGELCNSDKNSRIKFALVGPNNVMLHSAMTTLTDLEAGKTTLDMGTGATLIVDNFACVIKPTFVDYLRAGW